MAQRKPQKTPRVPRAAPESSEQRCASRGSLALGQSTEVATLVAPSMKTPHPNPIGLHGC
ncbi:hypothetical protein ACMHYB_48450 [Sorangium sp. So ce1128]